MDVLIAETSPAVKGLLTGYPEKIVFYCHLGLDY